MISRYLYGLAIVILVAGICVGVVGLHPRFNDGSTVKIGLLMMLSAMPVVFDWLIRRSQELAADQLTEARNGGYRLALEHVARGLLDQDTVPEPTGPHSAAGDNDNHQAARIVADHTLDNVRRLPIITNNNPPKEAAQ